MMLIYVFYDFLLFLGDPILLGRFKLRCEFLGLSVVDAKYLGCRADGDFILDDARECWVEPMRRHVEFLWWDLWGGRRKYLGLPLQLLFWECWVWYRKDLVLPLQCLYLRWCGGGRQAYLTVETFLEVTSTRGWGDEFKYQRDLSGGCDRLFFYEPSVFLCSPACLCVCNDEIKFWACTKASRRAEEKRGLIKK